ncbi:MAG: hypothetical protein A3G20_03175 [Acidobacteria bacterium RIFCSPLOWO2_12_FULL_59_11]|nr:MAG: hypothetical protein A3G20_03175 [Acidobacteria bacterium RIFCSPLOWO2_12_FULL_59_11]
MGKHKRNHNKASANKNPDGGKPISTLRNTAGEQAEYTDKGQEHTQMSSDDQQQKNWMEETFQIGI